MSQIEKRFHHHMNAWIETINSILWNVRDQDQAWRFINVKPDINESEKSLTECKDFLDFTGLLVKRRDVDKCDTDELGRLCMLHSAFQRKIEKQLEAH